MRSRKLARLKWGVGEAQPPPSPNCKQNAHMMGFNYAYALKQACTAQKTGGWLGCFLTSPTRQICLQQKHKQIKQT